jgi:hypothetical protein
MQASGLLLVIGLVVAFGASFPGLSQSARRRMLLFAGACAAPLFLRLWMFAVAA